MTLYIKIKLTSRTFFKKNTFFYLIHFFSGYNRLADVDFS
jgi:hypothetical protein